MAGTAILGACMPMVAVVVVGKTNSVRLLEEATEDAAAAAVARLFIPAIRLAMWAEEVPALREEMAAAVIRTNQAIGLRNTLKEVTPQVAAEVGPEAAVEMPVAQVTGALRRQEMADRDTIGP